MSPPIIIQVPLILSKQALCKSCLGAYMRFLKKTLSGTQLRSKHKGRGKGKGQIISSDAWSGQPQPRRQTMVHGIVGQTWEWHTVISGVDTSCPVQKRQALVFPMWLPPALILANSLLLGAAVSNP
ncbi:hypothetical protein NC652_005077 [Populus alba x Populus x berolinensis]|nr:hypothetical protein NC652_005077 [Populus alba x Populus x berolinensis]